MVEMGAEQMVVIRYSMALQLLAVVLAVVRYLHLRGKKHQTAEALAVAAKQLPRLVLLAAQEQRDRATMVALATRLPQEARVVVVVVLVL